MLVSLCLDVFSYETIAALETHPGIDQNEARGTIQFLKIMTAFLKILNTNEKGEFELFKDKLRGEISNHHFDDSLIYSVYIFDSSCLCSKVNS